MIQYHLQLNPSSVSVKLEVLGSRRILYADTLKAIAKPDDFPSLQFLTKLHIKAHGGRGIDTLSFQQIELPLPNVAEAILLLSKTNRLFFRAQKIVVSPKKKLFWKGEKNGPLRAYLNEVALESVDALMPQWAICGAAWFEIETTVSWKWIELFRNGPILLEGVQKKKFLDEEPPILWKEVVESPLQAVPELELADATGSFVNLWIHYPGVGRVAFEDLAPQVGGRTRLKADEAQYERDLLEAGFIRKAVGATRYYCPGEKVRATLRLLLEIGWRCKDARGKKVVLQTGTDLHAAEKKGVIAVKGKLSFREGEGELKKGIEAAARGRLLLDLDAERTGLLDLGSIPQLDGDWEEDELKIPKYRIGELVPLLQRDQVVWEESLRKAAAALHLGKGVEEAVLDGRFCGTLLDYQKEGVSWLAFLHQWGFGALLSDEMGLGKTVQVTAFFSQLRTNLPLLVVAPTSLLCQWKREIHRFWPDAQVSVHSGQDRGRLQSSQVILTSYAILRLDQEQFSALEYEAIALDESQAIKTASSQAARAACALKGRFKIAMTGTPVENRSDELWSQFRFIAPELLGEKSAFQSLDVESVRKKIKPFILRRKKSDVQIQLPEKIDRPVWVEMGEEQKALYLDAASGFRKRLEDGMLSGQMEVLEAILRLRQICVDPRLVGGQARGAKAEQLLIDAEALVLDGKKTLIFSQFTSALQCIQRDLKEIGIEPLYLDGSISQEERSLLVERFQNENVPHVFLLSLKAGGVGLNLTAAESVILFDPWWNDAVERQAIDRAHRIGQKNTLLIHRYLTADSIEEKILQLKAKKGALAEEILGENVSWTSADLLHLLN